MAADKAIIMSTIQRGMFPIILVLISAMCVGGVDELPCEYSRSKDISPGILNANGSIEFEGELFEYGLYSMVNYTMENGKRAEVAPYARACIYDNPLKCRFYESINITGSTPDENGLIVFDHMEFPLGTYAKVAYALKVTTKNEKEFFTRVPTPEHVRGCVCNRRSCVRFCCPSPYQLFVNGKCAHRDDSHIDLPIRIKDSAVKIVDFKKHFYYVTKKACRLLVQAEDEFHINQVSGRQELQLSTLLINFRLLPFRTDT